MFLKVQKESVLFDFLFDKVGTASKTKISKMIKHGQILVNSAVQFKQDFLLKEGDSIEIRKDGVNRKVSDLQDFSVFQQKNRTKKLFLKWYLNI